RKRPRAIVRTSRLAVSAFADSLSLANDLDYGLGDRRDLDWPTAAGRNQVHHRLRPQSQASARSLATLLSVAFEPETPAAGNRNCGFGRLAREDRNPSLGALVRDQNLKANSTEPTPTGIRACRTVAAPSRAGNSFRRSRIHLAGGRRERRR